MNTFSDFINKFDTQAFFNQFLYDPKNPLLFNNGFFVYFFFLFIFLFYLRERVEKRGAIYWATCRVGVVLAISLQERGS